MTEPEIRADERARCARRLQEAAAAGFAEQTAGTLRYAAELIQPTHRTPTEEST